MDLYIDKENLKSFIKAKNQDEYPDCLRMLRRQLHLVFNMDKSLLKEDPELLQWIIKASEGRGNSELTDTFLSDFFPVRPIKSNTYNGWNREQLSSVYLIDDIDCYKLKDKSCVLIGNTGEEISVLLRLFCGKDYDFHHLYDLQGNFNSWEQLNIDNQMLPCTDIILNDRYIFKNQEQLVEYNLKSLLEVLVKNVRNRVNIVVLTKNKEILSFGIDKAKAIVKETVSKITGVRPNLTFVTSTGNSLIPHDRFIITNYRLIRSGDSFIYFNTQGNKITNGGSLDIDSLANHETYSFVGSLLDKLQKNVNEIYSNERDMIFGDNVSNFLHFVGKK